VSLRAAPITLPCGLALALLAWWALDGGGFEVRQWAPGGLLLLGLLAVAIVAAPGAWRGTPRSVALAAAGLAAYAAWSFASITWADDPGYALEGATRTLVYVVVFCLFALWPQRGATGAALLAAWVVVVGAAGLVLALRLTGSADPADLFNIDRLRAPTGYPNATAALLMMPVLPAIVLAATRRLPWWARGSSAAIAVGLASLALLTVSRGAVYSTPLVLVALFVLVPGRVRHFYTLLPVGVAVAACAPRLLDVGAAVNAGDPSRALSRALGPVVAAAVAVGLLVALVAWLERRPAARPAITAQLARAARAGCIAVLVAGLAGFLIAGNPSARAQSAWTSFKGGYAENDATSNRLVGGLGSARYDFYRVSLRAVADRPLTGVGADNFYQQYLRDGKSAETPRYPHSVELRALAQTGVVGGLLLFGALAAALVAALRAMRTGGQLRRSAAGGATIGFLYWLVHGSVDWFWEWAGLGVPAFALLGLACALSRPSPPEAGAVRAPGRPSRRPPAIAAALAMGAVLAVPLLVLWAADQQQRGAVGVFATDPLAAFARLERSAELNPFSAAPETLAGSIALRFGDLPRADAAFARALERVPDDQYATLERGAIASTLGRRDQAERTLVRAVALAPRDPLAREALRIVRRGRKVDVAALNRRILAATRALSS
jgi:O-antigen ligase